MRCFDSSNKSMMSKEIKPLQFSYFKIVTYFSYNNDLALKTSI